MTDLTALRDALADRYEIVRELGRGGMATVFLARDVRHARQVAIKVLHPELAAVLGAERFLAEIKTTANLQHPHILPLFDSGSADGQLYYVMPFVEGETLRSRLDRETQLPIADAVRLARDVADALQHAHERGVIHRDIKPENILLQSGHALVADFGIALAVQQAGGQRMTQTGLSLGTPQYMAPEQAMGEKVVDARADIYALGAVTYEMLAGEPPVTGPTAQAIVARVMTTPPPSVSALRDAVSPQIDAALRMALAKLPADRFGSARDFADALRGERTLPIPSPTNGVGVSTRTATERRWTHVAIAASLVALLGAATTGWLATRAPAAPIVQHFDVSLPDSVTLFSGGGRKLAISRDGARMVFVGIRAGVLGLYLRDGEDTESQLIAGSLTASVRGSGLSPDISPDQRWIVYSASQGLMRIATDGGAPHVVVDSGSAPSWRGNDEVVYQEGDAIWRVAATGGTPTLVARPDTANGIYSLAWPSVLPDGRRALVQLNHSPPGGVLDSASLGVVDIEAGEVTDFHRYGTNPRYTASGYVLFGERQGRLAAVRYQPGQSALSSDPIDLLVDVWQGAAGAVSFAVADNGTLLYQRGTNAGINSLTMVWRDGRERRFSGTLGAGYPRVSPDGREAIVDGRARSKAGIAHVDLVTGNFDVLLPAGAASLGEWSRDGRSVIYRQAASRGVWASHVMLGDRRDATVLRHDSLDIVGIEMGPADGWSVVTVNAGGDNLYVAATESLPALRPLAVSRNAIEQKPSLSRDGRWVAYASDETGRFEVYVRPVPGPGARVKVSVDGGSDPVFSKVAMSLYYRAPGHMVVARLGGSPLQVQRTDTLFPDVYDRNFSGRRQWDLMPNDSAFLMVRTPPGGAQAKVIPNWRALLRRSASR